MQIYKPPSTTRDSDHADPNRVSTPEQVLAVAYTIADDDWRIMKLAAQAEFIKRSSGNMNDEIFDELNSLEIKPLDELLRNANPSNDSPAVDNEGHWAADVANHIASPFKYDSLDTLHMLPLDKRAALFGRQLQSLELIESCGNNELVGKHLYEMLFRTRDMLVMSPDFDIDTVVNQPGGRELITLYLASEEAYAKNFDTADKFIEELRATMPNIASILSRQLEEARSYAVESRSLDEQTSQQHLDNFIGSSRQACEQKAQQTEFGITIGIHTDSARRIFKEANSLIPSRLLAAPEFSTSGGKNIVKTADRHAGYNEKRQQTDIEQLDYPSDNIFIPQFIYGALNTSYRPDKGNGYGKVILHIRDKPGTSYTIGDSMPVDINARGNVKNTRLNRKDAELAAVYNESRGRHKPGVKGHWYDTNVAYIEAQIPGVSFQDIESVTINHSLDSSETVVKNREKTSELIRNIAQHSININIEFNSGPGLGGYLDDSDPTPYANQVRRHLDPTGTLWPMIDVTMVNPIPRDNETIQECAARLSTEQGMIVRLDAEDYKIE